MAGVVVSRKALAYHASMNRHGIPPPPGPLPLTGGSSFIRRALEAKRQSHLRQVVRDLAKYLPAEFVDERTCPRCVTEANDPRAARLLRLDMKLGFRDADDDDAVVLLCPSCGFEEEG